MSDGKTNDDMLHINNVLEGLARTTCGLIHRRQRGAGMNSSVMRRRKQRIKRHSERERYERKQKTRPKRELQGVVKKMTPIKECENQCERNPCENRDRNR